MPTKKKSSKKSITSSEKHLRPGMELFAYEQQLVDGVREIIQKYDELVSSFEIRHSKLPIHMRRFKLLKFTSGLDMLQFVVSEAEKRDRKAA